MVYRETTFIVGLNAVLLTLGCLLPECEKAFDIVELDFHFPIAFSFPIH